MRVTSRIWRGERSSLGVMMTVLKGPDWELHVMRVKAPVGRMKHEWYYQGMIVWEDGRVYRRHCTFDGWITEAKPLNEMFREKLGVTFITT